MSQLPVPDEILLFAAHQAGASFDLDYLQRDVEEARMRAVEAIRSYKQTKKQVADMQSRKSRISEWLKSIGHETRK